MSEETQGQPTVETPPETPPVEPTAPAGQPAPPETPPAAPPAPAAKFEFGDDDLAVTRQIHTEVQIGRAHV